MTTRQAVLLAGPMAVGKSSIGRHLESVGFRVAAFGDLVRRCANERGLDSTDRSVLQDIGRDMHQELGAIGMTRALLDLYPEDAQLVVDGIRHVDVLEALRAAADVTLFAYLTATESVLRDRWLSRGGDEEGWRLARSHVVESQHGQLESLADIVLDTSDIEARGVADRIEKALRLRGNLQG